MARPAFNTRRQPTRCSSTHVAIPQLHSRTLFCLPLRHHGRPGHLVAGNSSGSLRQARVRVRADYDRWEGQNNARPGSKAEEDHSSDQITLLLSMSMSLLCLPWAAQHPTALFIPLALAATPILGKGVRSVYKEACLALFSALSFALNASKAQQQQYQPQQMYAQQQHQQQHEHMHAQHLHQQHPPSPHPHHEQYQEPLHSSSVDPYLTRSSPTAYPASAAMDDSIATWPVSSSAALYQQQQQEQQQQQPPAGVVDAARGLSPYEATAPSEASSSVLDNISDADYSSAGPSPSSWYQHYNEVHRHQSLQQQQQQQQQGPFSAVLPEDALPWPSPPATGYASVPLVPPTGSGLLEGDSSQPPLGYTLPGEGPQGYQPEPDASVWGAAGASLHQQGDWVQEQVGQQAVGQQQQQQHQREQLGPEGWQRAVVSVLPFMKSWGGFL